MWTLPILVSAFVLSGDQPSDPAPAPAPKGHLVIIGGGIIPTEVRQRALDLSGGLKARIVIIPAAAMDGEAAARDVTDRFQGLGATNFETADLSKPEEALAMIQRADLIWFSGGDQTRITSGMANTTIPDAVFWYAPGTATDWLWTFAPGTAQQTSAPYVVNGTYRPFAGDFDQDTLGDLFWYAPGPAPDVRWMRTGTQAAASFTSATDPVSGTYVPIVGDFGTNGKFVAGTSDIAWTTTTGTDQIWDRQETSTHRSAATITAPKVVQVGRPGADALIGWGGTGGDIVWRSTTLGGDTSRRTDLAKVATDAIPVVGRFGDTDDESVLWYRPGAGAERYWTTYE